MYKKSLNKASNTEDLKFISDPMSVGRHIAELNATNNTLVRSYAGGVVWT